MPNSIFLYDNFLTILVLQVVCCAFMTGLIWLVQLVHYPAFAYVIDDLFSEFHKMHSKKISIIVMPVMLLELITAIALVYLYPQSSLILTNTIILIFIWLSTFALSVPVHNILSKDKNTNAIHRLIQTNWSRTALWTVRLFILIYFITKHVALNNSGIN